MQYIHQDVRTLFAMIKTQPGNLNQIHNLAQKVYSDILRSETYRESNYNVKAALIHAEMCAKFIADSTRAGTLIPPQRYNLLITEVTRMAADIETILKILKIEFAEIR